MSDDSIYYFITIYHYKLLSNLDLQKFKENFENCETPFMKCLYVKEFITIAYKNRKNF